MPNPEFEKEVLKEVGKQLDGATFSIGGEEVDSELMPEVIGNGLALIDCLIAIRDGAEWRGETDPQRMAGKALGVFGMTD